MRWNYPSHQKTSHVESKANIPSDNVLGAIERELLTRDLDETSRTWRWRSGRRRPSGRRGRRFCGRRRGWGVGAR